MIKFIIKMSICLLLLFKLIFAWSDFSFFNLSISVKEKPFSFSDYLIIPTSDYELAVVNSSFQIERVFNIPKYRFIKNYGDYLGIYGYSNNGYITSTIIYSNLNIENFNSDVVDELKGKKEVIFIDKDIIFDGSYVVDTKRGIKVNIPFGFRFIKSDGSFLFVVDTFDKLNVLDFSGNLVGKYNLGNSVSGVVMLDDNNFAICSIKGLYIISKPDFIVRKKYDFSRTPMGLYYDYPFVVFSTIEKLYVYNYLSGSFMAAPYYKVLANQFYSDYDEYVWIDGKSINIATLESYARESDSKLVYFDFCIFNNKVYAVVSREKNFSVDYYYYDNKSRKRSSINRNFYYYVNELIVLDPRTGAFSNRILDMYRSRYSYDYKGVYNYRCYLVPWKNQLLLVKSYRDYTSFYYINF
ncbi:MAG: hypothetical protein RMJ36_06390 [Candidatus Calescibacterium sp.]|nr:hypothetical protein [Candidatus Calescibacterium sp.]MDW8133264.1 hypothetical protein [Candidatus Calescibacterium sp.]